jgi:hypothetical protein
MLIPPLPTPLVNSGFCWRVIFDDAGANEEAMLPARSTLEQSGKLGTG